MTEVLLRVFSVTHLLSAAVCFTAFGYKWHDLRRDRRNLSLIALCAGRLLNGSAYLMLAPVSYIAIGKLSGIPNLATLIAYICIILAALFTHVMVYGWFKHPRAVRSSASLIVCFYLLAVLAMITLFFATPLPEPHPLDFEIHFAPVASASAYSLVFLTTYGLSLVNTARHAWPSSKVISRPWLSEVLRITAVGSWFVMGFIIGKLLGLVGRWCGTTAFDQAAVLWSPLMASVGSLALGVGYTLPRWGKGVDNRMRRFRSCRRLHPLWLALCQANPGIVLFETRPTRPRVWTRDLQTRLYRIVIEIRDGQRALQPYTRVPCVDALERILRAGPAREARPEVLREASALALAIRGKRRGAGTTGSSKLSTAQTGENFWDELTWLEDVAEEFQRLHNDSDPYVGRR
ncbi:MAB_1171c family putative transporter [Streptomyces sp. NPDC014882]|uniref:MAB_1171c family putative transporter n=1 Tax=Streptomyces sp. NPDC014882 TaxID=3364927 RepID=UPI0036F53624